MATSLYATAFLFSILLLQVMKTEARKVKATDPTYGFVSLRLNESNFVIQRPYNVPVHKRYSYVNGVHKLWVFKTDKPHSPASKTKPRTELRIKGHDYSSGVWQFQAHGFVPAGTSGVSVMQVFGAGREQKHATTMMLRVYDGSLSYYKKPVIVKKIYDRWFRLNVIHDVDANKVTVFIDGVKVFHAEARGGDDHFFKCGVYAQDNDSHRMESRWKGIKVYKKKMKKQ